VTDRALIFLVSVIMALGALGVAIWLIAAGQLGTFDGNFLFLSALVVAGAFGLYLKFLIARALERPAAPAVKAEKSKTEAHLEPVGKM
jgi:hypothetical protein